MYLDIVIKAVKIYLKVNTVEFPGANIEYANHCIGFKSRRISGINPY